MTKSWIARWVGFLVAAVPFTVFAQSWPSRPLTIEVGYTPGGPVDFVARAVAKGLSEQLGQPVLVDNKPGAGGTVAAASVARAQPDGYTMLLVVPGLTSAQSLYGNLRYDLAKDFAPISLVGTSPTWLLTPSDGPFKTVQDMVRQATANPGKYSYGHGATGGISNLTAELMKTRKGLNIKTIGYRGNSQSLTDVVAGRVELMFDQLSSSDAFVKSGKLRPLAVTSASRLPEYPDVPTMQEAGFDDFVIEVWYGLAFPAKTPKEVVQAAQIALTKVLAQPGLAGVLGRAGVTPTTTRPEQLQSLIQKDIAQWRVVIQKNSITAQ